VARVLILGGGFGGLAAATDLRALLGEGDEIVLLARDDRFAMGWTKLWDLTGIRPLEEGQRSLHALSDRGVRYVQADITAIDPEARAAATSEGDVEADALVVALGAADHPEQVAQLDGEVAHNLYSFAALPAAKRALAALGGGTLLVAVMGQPFKCPPAPFEGVLALDEHLRLRGDRDRVELEIATPAPSTLPVAGPEASRVIADALAERDIALRTERTATRIDTAGRTVTFDTGETTGFALLYAVPGNVPPRVVADSPLAGQGGWIHPDPRSLRTAFERVYAVGDCTTVPTATAALPKAGVFAAAEGRVVAHNVAADLGRGEPAQFDGRGHCYLEFPGRKVARVEGDFFAEPKPDVALEPPTSEAYEGKLAFEREHLAAWFGD
jgi:sulfide:quinone oxidoreductase